MRASKKLSTGKLTFVVRASKSCTRLVVVLVKSFLADPAKGNWLGGGSAGCDEPGNSAIGSTDRETPLQCCPTALAGC